MGKSEKQNYTKSSTIIHHEIAQGQSEQALMCVCPCVWEYRKGWDCGIGRNLTMYFELLMSVFLDTERMWGFSLYAQIPATLSWRSKAVTSNPACENSFRAASPANPVPITATLISFTAAMVSKCRTPRSKQTIALTVVNLDPREIQNISYGAVDGVDGDGSGGIDKPVLANESNSVTGGNLLFLILALGSGASRCGKTDFGFHKCESRFRNWRFVWPRVFML